jgi:3D (Asp-Asp-Asp) domain-containing protein
MERRTRRLIAAGVCALLCAALVVAPALSRSKKPLKKETWLSKVILTEYYPAPEKWADGALVSTPGLKRQSRIDWLYSATGMSMEGDGIGLDGKRYHIENLGSGGWITKKGKAARFGVGGEWAPFWRSSGYWRNRKKGVTFPLADGSWYAGKGKRYVPPAGITFAPGPSRDLRYMRSVAVDPKLIPMGSLVYVKKYADLELSKDGWFRADDTGGAIIGRHLDIYRKPPGSEANAGGRYFKSARIFVVPKAKVRAYMQREAAEDTDDLPLPPKILLR